MTTPPTPDQSDPADWFPLDPDEHAMQLAAVLDLAEDIRSGNGRPARILDLGAGNGRIVGPLHDAGHAVLAIDHDPRAVAALTGAGLRAIEADFLAPATLDPAALAHDAGPFDLALCLGNTFMTIHDVHDAAGLLRRLRPLLAHGGRFAIDAIATPMWREVAEGYWISGIAEDGSTQLVWEEGDPVFVVRDKPAMDPDHWHPKPGEPRARLWTLGCLNLLALATDWAPPDERVGAGITLFQRPA